MHPFWISFGILIVMLCLASLSYSRFLRIVRRDFPSLWQDMGGPTESEDDSLFDGLGAYWYLFRLRYQKRGDPDETRFCEQFRMPVLVPFLAAVLSSAVFAIGFVILGTP